jgi:hypothetical protein
MENQIDEKKLTLDCKGGGKIQVDPGTRTISVYGYSSVSYFLYVMKYFMYDHSFFSIRNLVELIMKKQ